MHRSKKAIYFMTMLILFVVCNIVFLVVNLICGSVSVPLNDVVCFVMEGVIEDTYRSIIMDIRFPRAMAAMILGGALSLSGYLLQTFFHNPIAGPFVLGISSGSKLIVASVMVLLAGSSLKVTSITLIVAAFIGAIISMGFVLLMSAKVSNMSMLVICGVMIGYICSAITDFIVTFANDAEIVNLHNWSKGSFSGMSWEHVKMVSVIVLVTTVAVFLLSKPISAYQLGENYAKSMGVHVQAIRVWLIIFSSILSACVVAYAGPISFVGIAVPHLMKKMMGTTKPIWMIPACFLGGSVFCLICDLISRMAFSPTELSISTVTAIFGAPVVLWIMTERKKERG